MTRRWAETLRRHIRARALAPGTRRWRLIAYLLTARIRLLHAVARAQAMRRNGRPRHWAPPSALRGSSVGLRFQAVSEPAVSVVIPVFNHLPTTLDCLRSLCVNTPLEIVELIVVDDCSTDGTPDELPRIPGIRYIRSPENRGFCATAHRGATAARGGYVVFLNNDTLVQPGWLEPLVEVAENASDVGAVGSKLIYPDGVLQEAGCVVWRDGSAANIGRRGDPSAPEFNYSREVDYCSAASLLVRRDLYERVGGIDMRFAPGYYEDADLCFSLRALGYRVIYEPRSTVVHLEGISHGADYRPTASQGKERQYFNRNTFVSKWSAVLETHALPHRVVLPERGLLNQPTAVLVCDNRVPAPDRDAGSSRMYWILRLLAEMGCTTTFFPLDRDPRGVYSRDLERRGVEVNVTGSTLKGLLRSRRGSYGLVVLSRPQATAAAYAWVRRFLPSAKVVYDTVDLSFVRRQRERDLTSRSPSPAVDAAGMTELRLIRGADVVATVTDDEAQVIKRLCPGVTTVVLPTVHPPDTQRIVGFEARAGLLFIGSFLHQPNVDAMKYFVKDVLPLISRAIDAPLTIVGPAAPPEIQGLASSEVRVLGYVADADPLFRSSRVFVSPLRYGAGMKGKNGQALSFGLPVVTTSVGAEGMHLVDGQHALIRDDPAGFAGAVVDLYTTPALWSTLSSEGLLMVEEQWSPEAMRRRLRGLVTDAPRLAPNRREPTSRIGPIPR